MASRTIFILEWFVVPLVGAAALAFTQWGQSSLVYIIATPIIVLVWRMWILSRRRERMAFQLSAIAIRVPSWHALSLLACVFLMAFEAGVAALAQTSVTDWVTWLIFSLCTYGMFVSISTLAERQLARGVVGPT